MTSSSADLDRDLNPDGPSSTDRPRLFSMLGKVLVVLIVLGSFAIWIYAFSGAARRDAPDLLAYREFPEQAELVCAGALAELDELPNALDARDPQDRANQIVISTERFETMLDDLDPLVGGDARDLEISQAWLGEWRVLIEDRYDYAQRIAADPNAQFYVTDTGSGERLDRRLTRMAKTNSMPSCAAPGDVG